MHRPAGFATTVLTAALAVVVSVPAATAAPYESTDAEVFTGGVSPEQELAAMAVLHGWLVKQMPDGVRNNPIRITLTGQDIEELRLKQQEKNGPAVVGRTKPISEVVRFNPLDAALLGETPRHVGRGLLRSTSDGGFVWAAAIVSEGASGLRVHINGLDLPDRAELYFFDMGGRAFGPYTGRGPRQDGEFWSNTIRGQEGILLLRHHGPHGAADLQKISFVLADAGHVGQRFVQVFGGGIRPESFCQYNVECIENAACHNVSAVSGAKNAVALLQWVGGAFIYTCTGGLLADNVAGSDIPYMLTANHCIKSNKVAGDIEAWFQYTIPCGSTTCSEDPTAPGIQRLGATLKVTGTAGDFTLLQLNQVPPSGSVFLGTTNAPVANTNGATLHRISHPNWAPQAYSRQAVDTGAGTCSGLPRGTFIYSREQVGGTEGGSSGSPVVNGSGQVVGQLYGGCGTNINDDCDQVNNATVDGAMAAYWASVAPFLAPSGGGCFPAGQACTSNSQCCSNQCRGQGGNKTCR